MTTILSSPSRPTVTPAPASRRRLAVFVGSVLVLGWLGPVIDVAIGDGDGSGQLLWILLPVGTAILLRWKGGDGFGDAGLAPRYRQNRRWYDLSSAFYPVIMLAATAYSIAVSQVQLAADVSLLRFAALAAVGLVPFTVTAIAEEFGWRGYLTPRLDAAGVGRLTNHAIVGVVWGAWHLPYMAQLWDGSGESLWTLAPRVMIGTTVASVVYGEIRLRTGSVWPAVIMHACGNAVAAALLHTDSGLVQTDALNGVYSPGVDGAVVIVLTGVLAALLLTRQASMSPRTAVNNDKQPILSRSKLWRRR